jgi:Cu(I)/Ag(I) efflux system membrane protein CusA/SilA
LLDSAKQVGPAIFFSLLIIVVSFLPVFLLEAQEGRMFRPLAWTKTLAVGFSSLLAITLVPVLMVLFIRGRLRPESRHPVSRVTQALYLPVLRLCLRFRKTTLLLNLIFLVVTLPLALKIGSQFMPPLFEGSALYMPTALPGISIGQASQLLQEQDRIIRTFPEVETVFGTIGRSDSATDNAPLDMYDTTIMLKPLEKWRVGVTCETPVPRSLEHLDYASKKPLGHGIDRHQDSARDENTGPDSRRHPASWRADPTGPFRSSASSIRFFRACLAGLLRQRRSQS